jgi:choline dehydrogenase-like flavoprotein
MGKAASTDKFQYGFPTPGPQSPTGQKVMDHVFFLSNAEWKKAREDNIYDFVVVGTGFCALAFVERALKKNKNARILLIERGTFFLPEHFQNLPLPFKDTLGGLSETFPWTMSITNQQDSSPLKWQHGMVPFVGGRSTLWSAWCPRPNGQEFDGWPEATIQAAKSNFDSAEKLLRVKPADEIDGNRSAAEREFLCQQRPVYGALQNRVQTLLAENYDKVAGIYRTEPAPLACASDDGIDFQKFATPGEILEIVDKYRNNTDEDKGPRVDVVCDCVVEKINQQETANGDRQATALQTSRGFFALGDAQLILAMGTLPPTTLLRNSFPEKQHLDERFSAHFITSIVARVPKVDLDPNNDFSSLELGACYIAGVANDDYKQQYHIQLSALSDKKPQKNAATALRYMPDVVATASMAQLIVSKDYVVFVCAVLGELDFRNKDTWFRKNGDDSSITTNSLLQMSINDADKKTWDAMDEATFGILEQVLSPAGPQAVEYWKSEPTEKDPDAGRFVSCREKFRVDATVHESSTLHLGEEDTAPVDLDYRFKGSTNVYVTGGALWPQGGSWNPTMTMVALAQDLADKLAD